MSLPSSFSKESNINHEKITLTPQILWPSIEYGNGIQSTSLKKFPEENLIIERYKKITQEDNTYFLPEFQDAIVDAEERLWIIDSNFDDYGMKSILTAVSLSNVKQIWILTGSKDQKEFGDRWLLDLKDARNNRKEVKDHIDGNIQWKIHLDKNKYPYLHDRFAIVDQELWHFGATVGGGHPSLNAVTRGWDAEKTEAIAFFKNVWFKN